MDAQLKRGMLDACVLAVLSRGDSYGYKLTEDVGKLISVSESTLYPILRRLESAGMVTVYSVEHRGRLRKYYSITDAGRRRITDFLSQWREVARALQIIEGEVLGNDHEA